MTHLRKRMLEELERRNYTESTTRVYLATISDFAAYFHQSPEHLGPEHIREYIAYLFRERRLSDKTVNQRVGALRFLYVKTLKRNWSVEETPYPKKRFHLPTVSQEEVSRLIAAALTPFHRTILMTLYATGVRRTELAHLKLSDVDSARMVLHVRGGKGRKDRDVMLSRFSSKSCGSITGGSRESPPNGSFPGDSTIHRQNNRSATKSSGTPAAKLPSAPASTRSFTPTPYGTASRLTYSKPAPTSGASRFCSATATSKKPPSTCICRSGI